MNKQQEVINSFLDKQYIPLEPKIKIALGVALLIIPAVAFYFFIFQPNSAKIKSLENQEKNLQAKVFSARKKAQNIKKFQKEFQETEIKFIETTDMLPKEKEIPQLLKDISGLGQNAGLDFISFSPGNESPKDFYAEFPINIEVKGPYHNMGFFLDQVSKLNRIVTVSNIKMSSPKKEGNEMLLKSSCKLMTYRFTNQPLQPADGKKKKGRK